jgi:formylglycine-generating enzyme required for sulfatase activity
MVEDANFLWFASNSDGRTQPVGTRRPNAWGLRDTIGNVWEWTWDAFGPYPGDVTDPTGASEGFARAVRGGGYSSDGQFIRAAVHDQNSWDAPNQTLGFRLVRTLP